MTEIKDMKKKELVDEYVSLCEQIDGEEGCFGVKDLICREQLEREINKRGYKIRTRVEVE